MDELQKAVQKTSSDSIYKREDFDVALKELKQLAEEIKTDKEVDSNHESR